MTEKNSLTLAELLQVMKRSFEKAYDCSISFYKGPDVIALLKFCYKTRHIISVEVRSDARYTLKDWPPHGYESDLRPVAHTLKNASKLLHLLKDCHNLTTKAQKEESSKSPPTSSST